MITSGEVSIGTMPGGHVTMIVNGFLYSRNRDTDLTSVKLTQPLNPFRLEPHPKLKIEETPGGGAGERERGGNGKCNVKK